MNNYFTDNKKEHCFGCEACHQICPKNAISMNEDEEGFRYPVIDENLCVNCGLCKNICPYSSMPKSYSENKTVFGGYHKDNIVREKSTSGGAFSAIVEAFCDSNYVIFGAESKGLDVFHSCIDNVDLIDKFRKSKYSQSIIGQSYNQVKQFLNNGKKVLFSGTPCQIAGLKSYLNSTNQENLLTVEVVCEGVPTPHFIRKYDEYVTKKYRSHIKILDYRYTSAKPTKNPKKGKWDFQVMLTVLDNNKTLKKDRWFNPFWSIWLNHLMSRPSCYECPFTTTSRVADITLGDLWGVHLYCPELYGKNLGSSLIVANNEKGKQVLEKAKSLLYGHELDFNTALKYQSPMRKTISYNPKREKFMLDVKDLGYKSLCKKWAKKPTLKLLYQKYIWGNRQKIALWNFKTKFKRRKKDD